MNGLTNCDMAIQWDTKQKKKRERMAVNIYNNINTTQIIILKKRSQIQKHMPHMITFI